MTCTLSKEVFMPITNKKPWLMHMLSYSHPAECCDILYTTLLHLQNKMILCWLEITQSFSYTFVPNLILTPTEYTFTLSQSQVLKVLDAIGIDYKSSKLSANLSINTCYMHMLYLLVIPTSKQSGSDHEAEISSSSSKHLSSHQKGQVGRKLQNPTKKPPLLSMADSTVTSGAHFICRCSIRKCPQVACNHATCLPPLVARSPQFVWLSAIQQWYRWQLPAEDGNGTSRKAKWP